MKTEIKRSVFELKQLIVPPGNKVQLQNISWQMFENILDELGEDYHFRLAYNKGMLEIMTPLPEHEDDKEIIGDLVKALLEELNIEFRSLGSTTFKREDMQSGVEPDQCFYIHNEAVIRGKKEINLNTDPPPDLAIEIDITNSSQSRVSSYEALGVPELWRYDGRVLQINLLRDRKYIQSTISLNFPKLAIIEVIPQFTDQSKTAGRNSTIRAFRSWVGEQIQQ